MKIVIPFSLPGLNEYIAACRENPKKGGAMKRKWDNAVAMAIRHQIKRPLREPVVMDYVWVERDRRRDKDNICGFGRKVIQDAFVQVHALRNDGWANIKNFSDDFCVTRSALASKSRYGRAWNDNQRPLRHQPSAHQAR